MPRYFSLFLLVLAAALLLGLACSDRGTNLPESAPYDGIYGLSPKGDHSYDSLLALQLINTDEVWLGATYIPKVSLSPLDGGNDQPVPTLILLPPQDADKFYFFRAGLLELVQELIATGEIEPMVIHCPANAVAFGGFMYGDSPPAGHIDDIIGDRMLTYLFDLIPPTISTLKSKRGVGGVGMGAYGAFRAALKHPDAFGSISAVDGPLDFDGAGNSGLISYFQAALDEQPTLSRYNIWDTAAGAYTDTFTYRDFDSGDGFVSLSLSRLFIGASMAFSLHQTDVTWDWDATQTFASGARAVLLSVNDTIADDLTKIGPIQGRGNATWDYHLPFDSLGIKSDIIWPMWMSHNLDTLYTHDSLAAGTPFDSTDIWIANNPAAEWNYGEMTGEWINFLEGAIGDTAVVVHNYGSFTDEPLTGNEYVYDLLREMLIFHSNSFEK